MRLLIIHYCLYWSYMCASSYDMDIVSSGDGEGSGDRDSHSLFVGKVEMNQSDIYFDHGPFITEPLQRLGFSTGAPEYNPSYHEKYEHLTTKRLRGKQTYTGDMQGQQNDKSNSTAGIQRMTTLVNYNIVVSPAAEFNRVTTERATKEPLKQYDINHQTTKQATKQPSKESDTNHQTTKQTITDKIQRTTTEPVPTANPAKVNPWETKMTTPYREGTTPHYTENKGFLGNDTWPCAASNPEQMLCPDISMHISKTYVKLKLGARVKFPCKVYLRHFLNTQLSLTWHIKEQVICSSNRSLDDRYECNTSSHAVGNDSISTVIEVTLREARLEDSGEYTCSGQYSCCVDEAVTNQTITSSVHFEVYENISYLEELLVIYSILLGLLVLIVVVEMLQWKKYRTNKNLTKNRIRSSIIATQRGRIPLPPAIQDPHEQFEDVDFDTP